MKPPSFDEQFAVLYPALSPKERAEAEYNFKRYLEVVLSIAEEQEGNAKHAIENHGTSRE